jgi:hypothetical protein
MTFSNETLSPMHNFSRAGLTDKTITGAVRTALFYST